MKHGKKNRKSAIIDQEYRVEERIAQSVRLGPVALATWSQLEQRLVNFLHGLTVLLDLDDVPPVVLSHDLEVTRPSRRSPFRVGGAKVKYAAEISHSTQLTVEMMRRLNSLATDTTRREIMEKHELKLAVRDAIYGCSSHPLRVRRNQEVE